MSRPVRGATVSRRHALTGAATAGLGLPLLSACGGDSETASDGGSAPSSSAPSTSASGGSGGAIATTADVPVGGGLIVADSQVVITQPTEGQFKGFSSTCTHEGCQVAEVQETINCPCHGSTFSLETGEPTGGPAPSPLGEVPLDVQGDRISLA